MEENVHYRRATVEDVAAVIELGKMLEFHEGDNTTELSSRGFLLFVKPEEAYAKRFSFSQYCSVAERGRTIVGFLIAHDRRELEAMGDLLQYPKALLQKLYALEHPHWIYIDQIAVHPEYQHQGIGQHLYDFVFGDTKASFLIAGVTHKPIANLVSRSFFEKNGHTLCTEFTGGRWLCGLYGRDIA